MKKILIFGDDESVEFVCKSMGLSSFNAHSAIIYFEFPNSSSPYIKEESFRGAKIKLYMLRPNFFQTIIIPKKKELREADLLLWAISLGKNENSSVIDKVSIGIQFLKQISLSRKSFLPIFLLGWDPENRDGNDKGGVSKDAQAKLIEQGALFLRMLEFRSRLSNLINFPVRYFHLHTHIDPSENTNFIKFIKTLYEFINYLSERYGNTYRIQTYSSILIERFIESLGAISLELFGSRNAVDGEDRTRGFEALTQYLRNIARLELSIGYPVTRKRLIDIFNCRPKISKLICDRWECRPTLDSEYISLNMADSIRANCLDLKEYCLQQNIPLILTNLVAAGYDILMSQALLLHLKELGEIDEVYGHIIDPNYNDFRNIGEIIVRHSGSVIFARSSMSMDKTLMFSDFIYSLESIRNEYLLKSNNRDKLESKHKIEFLDFGDLHALIGTGLSGLKIILRFNSPNIDRNAIYNRAMAFIMDFEGNISEELLHDSSRQPELRRECGRLLDKHFNPFPREVDVFADYSLNSDEIREKKMYLTSLELEIIDVIEQYLAQNKLSKFHLHDILDFITDNLKVYARSDVIAYLIDLINEGFIS